MILNTDEVKSSTPDQTAKAVLGRHIISLDKQVPLESMKKPKKKEHKCCILGPFMKREDELIESKPTYPFEVAKITEFVGRQREM